MCVMFDRKHLDTVNNQTIYLNNGFTLCRWELIITWMWLSPVCIPVMRPFRVRCGLAGRNSSMSLSEPSSSGTSMSESSSFTVDEISWESSVKSYRKVWMGLCDRFLSLTLCVCLSYRNSSSAPFPLLSVCSALTSECFQLPAAEKENNTDIKFACAWLGQIVWMLVIHKEFYGTFICRTFEKKCFAYCIFKHLKPLLFQSVILIKLRLQKGEVSELLHVGLIVFLQIFLDLLVFIHERWSKRLRKNNNLFV